MLSNVAVSKNDQITKTHSGTISCSITLYILFQIRSRRQKKMIEGGYHGLEGGFEARRRGEKGKRKVLGFKRVKFS